MSMFNEHEVAQHFSHAKCPCCGKQIMIPKDLTDVYCPYCGRQFLADAAVQYAASAFLHGRASHPIINVSSEQNTAEHPMPHMMTVRQIAETGVLSEAAIRQLLKQKRIPAVYIGSKALINYDKLLEFLGSNSEDSFT